MKPIINCSLFIVFALLTSSSRAANMIRSSLILLMCVFGAVSIFPTNALGDDDAVKYAIMDCQQHLDNARDTVANLETAYGPTGDFAATDLVKMDSDYRVTIAAWEQALAAYQKGDVAKGEALRTAATKAAPPIDWPRRLGYRQRMYYLDLNDRWVLANISWTTPPALPYLSAWVKVKKKCSLAWNRAAESMTDDTDTTHPIPAAEIQAVEAAKAADIEEETARMDFELAKSIYNDLFRDKDVTSPELVKTVDAMRALEKQQVSLRLEDIERDRRSREYVRQMTQLQQDAQKALAAAKQARDDAQKAREQAAQNKH